MTRPVRALASVVPPQVRARAVRRMRDSARLRRARTWLDRQDMLREPIDDQEWRIIETVRPHTLTDPTAVYGLLKAVQHVNDRGIPGALVECGVARGGSAMAMAMQCATTGHDDRDLYLFDTFDGCPPPTEDDGPILTGASAQQVWQAAVQDPEQAWFQELEGVVRANLAATGHPTSRTHLVRGMVEDTIPGRAPERIALLRLDTDWYQSTRHEMEHLWPRVVPGGVIVVDDYGWFESARRAVEEYFEHSEQPRPLLHRLNVTVRMGVKA